MPNIEHVERANKIIYISFLLLNDEKYIRKKGEQFMYIDNRHHQ